ncbi:hypothetical protein [Veillonella criceti]|uniref:Uncharacterized protein n=1 Tax=Veillonella criceti TaxID=103891 RepID=A0A380NMB1_9FIRM|nr:hypothetical protein [Veillonella criceti]SUP43867.1 Uncharacterised protein [Veillonella criceti]
MYNKEKEGILLHVGSYTKPLHADIVVHEEHDFSKYGTKTPEQIRQAYYKSKLHRKNHYS